MKLALLAAVLERHVGDSIAGCDLYINVVGGLKLHDPSCDLAVILAMASSGRNKPLPADLWVGGEVGLTGELRPITGMEIRAAEAARAGYRRIMIPASTGELPRVPDSVDIIRVERLPVAIAIAFERD